MLISQTQWPIATSPASAIPVFFQWLCRKTFFLIGTWNIEFWILNLGVIAWSLYPFSVFHLVPAVSGLCLVPTVPSIKIDTTAEKRLTEKKDMQTQDLQSCPEPAAAFRQLNICHKCNTVTPSVNVLIFNFKKISLNIPFSGFEILKMLIAVPWIKKHCKQMRTNNLAPVLGVSIRSKATK